MTRIPLLLAMCLPMVVIAAPEQTTLSVLSEYFRYEQYGPCFEKRPHAISLEICFDTCDYCRASAGATESDIWDLAFLHQYYFNDPYHLETFREKYDAIAEQTLRSHAVGCQAKSERKLAHCALTRLAVQMKAYYAFVRYDEGARCQVTGRLTDPTFQGKSVCEQLK